MGSSYVKDIKSSWRPLAAAFIGMGIGSALFGSINNVTAPALIAENGWTRSEYAGITSLFIVHILLFPLVGRLADVLGLRRTVLVGLIGNPICFVALSLMNGAIETYIAIYLLQSSLCLTTTATVFSRLVIDNVREARGLALALVASGPAAFGAAGSPVLNWLVETGGWRETYLALAVFTLALGAISFLLIPRPVTTAMSSTLNERLKARRRPEFSLIAAHPIFWLLVAAMLLCNLPQILLLSQLKMLLVESGAAKADVGLLLGAASLGVLIGRFTAGLCLDHFRPELVACLGLSCPCIGIFIFASGMSGTYALLIAVLSLGVAFGAEGDVVAFLVAKHFPEEIFSSVMGWVTASASLSISGGALLLSIMLAEDDSYVRFLHIAGAAVAAGAILILFLPVAERLKPRRSAAS